MRLPVLALLHGRLPVTPGDVWSAWTFDPLVLIPLIAVGTLYARGLRTLWRRAGTGRGIRTWQAASFAAGLATLLLAQVTPLAQLGGTLFSAHMTQHMLIIAVAAPLLVLGAPAIAFAWGLPPDVITRCRSLVLHRRAFIRAVAVLSLRLMAWTLHAAAVWIWHVPALYSRTVESEAAHALQHFTFFSTAILFWWVLRRRSMHGVGVLYVFTTAVHTSLLGAILVVERSPLYAPYLETTALWGLTALEDQQLGGLIMWVPGGVIYLVAALALLGSLLSHAGRRTAARAA